MGHLIYLLLPDSSLSRRKKVKALLPGLSPASHMKAEITISHIFH